MIAGNEIRYPSFLRAIHPPISRSFTPPLPFAMISVPVTLGDTIGAAFLGCIAASILYGISNLQVFVYYQSYPNDWRFQKYAVAFLWLMDTFHLALTIHAVYHYAIGSFGDFSAQAILFWSFKLQIAITIVIVQAVQSLYALRVWKIAHNYSKFWPLVVIASVAAGYAVGIILIFETYRSRVFADIPNMAWAIYLSFASKTTGDIVIAVAICYYLSKGKSGFKSTNSKLQKVMRFVIGSGALTSACSITALITFAVMPNNMVWIGVEFLLTKLYINSFLAMLNARKTIHDNETSISQKLSGSRLLSINTFGTPAQRIPIDYNSTPDLGRDHKDSINLLLLSRRSTSKGLNLERSHSREPIGISVHKQVETKIDAPELGKSSPL